MHLHTSRTTNRVNPGELRRLRHTVATTTLTCRRTAIQAAVTTAHVAHGEDWSQEAAVLMAEEQMSPLRLVRRTEDELPPLTPAA